MWLAISTVIRIKESSRLENTFKIMKSNRWPSASHHQTTSVGATSIHFLNTSRSRDSTTSWAACLMLDCPFCEEIVTDVQSKPTLVQVEAVGLLPISCHLQKGTDSLLAAAYLQVVVEGNVVCPQPPLQTKQPQFPQLLLIRLVFSPFASFSCSALYMLKHLNIPCTVRGPKLNTVFEVRSHQCWIQRDNHFSCPAGCTISNVGQDAISFLGHFMFSWLSACIPTSFSSGQLSIHSSQSLHLCMGLLWSRCRTWHYPLLNVMRLDLSSVRS